MTAALRPGISACPACAAAPAAEALAEAAVPASGDIVLSLPGMHCAGCISKVEQALVGHPGVTAARVNLTLRRATVEAAPGVTAEALAGTLAGIGYEAHELDPGTLAATQNDRAGRDLLMRLAVAGFASMNVMLLSVAVWSGASDATRDLFHWISAAIALPAIAFSGKPFFVNAWSALSRRQLNMDVPIALAIVLALVTSLLETALSGEHAYFDAALALTFFLLTGRYLDHRTRAIARSAAQELAALEVPRATRLAADGSSEIVPASQLRPGDLLRVPPGGRMPVDGIIEDGRSELDRSLLTGETAPVPAAPGQSVSAGEVNLTGPLTLRATATGQDTSLHRMANLVAIAESGRDHYTPLADKAAKLYAPGVHILSALAFAGWLAWSGDMRVALNIAAAVLIITCPCALGLAVPAVTTAASGRLFRRGLLIKDGTALERLAGADTVVFDKTGTLTEGTPRLDDAAAHDAQDLAIARALAQGSAHPLARAIAAAAEARGIEAAEVTAIREHPGDGTEGLWQGRPVRLGRAEWAGAAPLDRTATYLSVDGQPRPAFAFADRLREGAAECVAALQKAGLEVILLSGDTAGAVEDMATRLGITKWAAGARPEAKLDRIRALEAEGRKVLMIGDGLNDTAALSAAHVSISPASALDAARTASDIVLLGGALTPVPDALQVARRAGRRITENFRIATLYNVIAVPLAVAGLATPLIAALAMSASSITVSLNALRLR